MVQHKNKQKNMHRKKNIKTAAQKDFNITMAHFSPFTRLLNAFRFLLDRSSSLFSSCSSNASRDPQTTTALSSTWRSEEKATESTSLTHWSNKKKKNMSTWFFLQRGTAVC